MSERRQTDPKDFYVKYFKEMQNYFDLRQIAINSAMDKVNKMLEAKS